MTCTAQYELPICKTETLYFTGQRISFRYFPVDWKLVIVSSTFFDRQKPIYVSRRVVFLEIVLVLRSCTDSIFRTQRLYNNLSQVMRLWYLPHRRPVKAQACLRIHAVSPQPSLFTNIKYGSRRMVRPKIRHLAILDGCACAFEFKDERCHNLMSRLISSLRHQNVC